MMKYPTAEEIRAAARRLTRLDPGAATKELARLLGVEFVGGRPDPRRSDAPVRFGHHEGVLRVCIDSVDAVMVFDALFRRWERESP